MPIDLDALSRVTYLYEEYEPATTTTPNSVTINTGGYASDYTVNHTSWDREYISYWQGRPIAFYPRDADDRCKEEDEPFTLSDEMKKYLDSLEQTSE